MAQYNYAFDKFNKESMARAVGRDLPISTKQAIEICNFARKKNLQTIKEIFRQVIKKRTAIPFRRFTEGAGHKAGMAAGKYPVKACGHLLKLLESAEINAQQKGLNTSNLLIIHICAQGGPTPWHYGRHRRRRMKRTHVEVVVEERGGKAKEQKPSKAEEKKEEAKSKSHPKEEKSDKK